MSTQVAEKANLRLDDSLAVWTGDDSRMCCGGSLALEFLACFRFHSARSFIQGERHSARSFIQGGAPLSTVLSSVFQGDLQIVFEMFLLPSLLALTFV